MPVADRQQVGRPQQTANMFGPKRWFAHSRRSFLCISTRRPFSPRPVFEYTPAMEWFPKEKHRIDFLSLATRKEKNPWLEKFYLVVGLGFFAWVFYQMFFGN